MTTEQHRLEKIMRDTLEDCTRLACGTRFEGGLTAEQKAIFEQYFFSDNKSEQ